MKKILIIVATVIVALALTPIVGNKVIESKLNENIDKLSSSGLEIKKQTSDSSYLNTSKHYEFVVKDSDKLKEYLSNLTDQKIAPYVKTLFEDVVVGVDLKYSNIPFASTTSIDIYPISLGHKTMMIIQEEDPDFASYIDKFLKNGGLSYHIDYDMLSQDFKGYIKDIKESYTFEASQKLDLELKDSTFVGNGTLIAPNYFDSVTKKLYVHLRSKTSEADVNLKNLMFSSNFESFTTYKTDLSLDSFKADIQDISTGNSKVDMKDLAFSFNSSTDGQSAELNSKFSFDKIDIKSAKQSIHMDSFNFDTSLKGIDKDSFEELSRLLSKAKNINDSTINLKLQKLLQKLFLRGFDLNVKDMSIKNIKLNNTKELKSSRIKADIKLPQNVMTNTTNPMELIDKIEIEMLINISKPMFALITKSAPIVAISQGFAKASGDSLVYDIKVKDGSVTVNGKRIK